MDIPRRKPEDEEAIRARKSLAGRFGFIFGCVAAASAIGINIYRVSDYNFTTLSLAVLLSALNVPIGIWLGLIGERITRPRR